MEHANEPSEDTIKVEVGAIGSEMKVVILNGERTVRAALIAANYSGDEEVRVNGENYSGDDKVADNDSMIVVNVEKPKGAL